MSNFSGITLGYEEKSMLGEELLYGIAGMVVGGWMGHRLALGRDKRKERNAARLPIWRAFSEKDDRLNIYSRPFDTSIDEIAHYKAITNPREWKTYQRHAAEIKRVRSLEEWGDYDPKTGTYPILRELTKKETAILDHHIAKIVRLTRQR